MEGHIDPKMSWWEKSILFLIVATIFFALLVSCVSFEQDGKTLPLRTEVFLDSSD